MRPARRTSHALWLEPEGRREGGPFNIMNWKRYAVIAVVAIVAVAAFNKFLGPRLGISA